MSKEEQFYLKNVLGVEEIEEFPEKSKWTECEKLDQYWYNISLNNSKNYELVEYRESLETPKKFKIKNLFTGNFTHSDDFCFSGLSYLDESPQFSICKDPCEGHKPCLR